MTVCFEPRSNTAVTAVFQDGFTQVLSAADRVYLGVVHRAERIKDSERLDTSSMAQAIKNSGKVAYACTTHKELADRLFQDISEAAGGLIVFFTNGSFDGVPKKTADRMASGLKF